MATYFRVHVQETDGTTDAFTSDRLYTALGLAVEYVRQHGPDTAITIERHVTDEHGNDVVASACKW